MSVQEVTLKFRGDPAQLLAAINQMKSAHGAAMSEIRVQAAGASRARQATTQGELSMQKQLAAAASLQRQRSAALIAQWKQQERAAARLAAGVKPVATNLQQITDIMRTLGSSIGVLQGPLNGISGRFTALGTLARSAGADVAGAGTAAATSGGQIAAIAGPIGIAVIAMAALAAGAVVLSKWLFDLAVAAADFRGKMFDLSQQTGVAVEVLSTLEIMAATTGGSIDSIAQSLVIFQGHLDDAQDSSSEMAKKFKELGISTNNTEQAFTDALTVLAKMPEGFHQTNEAAELFGRRGGKQVLAILKEMDGDLPGTTAKLRAMGLVISNEDAKAADEFNDQLAILQFQFRALLGKEVIPAALIALRSLSDLLSQNRQSVDAIGQSIGILSNVILAGFLVQLQQVTLALVALNAAAAALDRLRGITFSGVSGGAGGENSLARVEGGASAVVRAGGGGGGSGRAARNTEADRAAAEEKQRLAFFQNLNEQLGRLRDQLKGVDVDTKAYAVQQSILNGVLAGGSGEMQKMALAVAKTIDIDQKRLGFMKQITDFYKDQNEAIKLVLEGERNHLELAEDFIKSLEKQGAVIPETIKWWIRFNASILQANTSLEKAIELNDSLNRELVIQGVESSTEDEIARRSGEAADREAGTPPPPPPVPIQVIDSWMILKQTATDALFSMAQGIGDLIQQWVIYGSVGPNAVRKMLAAVLAAAAAQAAVEAIMQLAHAAKEYALGLAAASNPFTAAMAPGHFAAASAHLIAAGVYGAVAGVAAVSGRLVAGNTFNQTTGGSSGSSNSGNRSSGSTGSPATVETDRRQGSQAIILQPKINVTVTGQATEGFRYMVEKVAIESVRGNGPFRKIQTGEDV